MRQLVGSICVLCRKRIGSIIEGHFCRACSQPVHEACLPRERPLESPGHCTECGASAAVSAPFAEVTKGGEAAPLPKKDGPIGLFFRVGHVVQFLVAGVFTFILACFLLFDPDLRGGSRWSLREMAPGLMALFAALLCFGAVLYLLRRRTKK